MTYVLSCSVLLTLCDPMDYNPLGSSGMGCLFLLQGVFLTHGANPHLLHGQMNSLPLSHLRSPYNGIITSFTLFSLPSNSCLFCLRMFPCSHHPWKPLVLCHLHIFTFSSMSYNWSHKLSNLFRLASFTQ